MIVFQIIGIVLGALAGLFILELAIVAFIPGFSVPKQPLEGGIRPAPESGAGRGLPMKDVSFKVGGVSISAWLYLPEDRSAPAPCIVMAHGLGGAKDAGLDVYASRFQEAGFAVLAFDYRHFGASGGEPRQLIWIPHQLEDYAAAIEYARTLTVVDPGRIALWGTSFSGGHVIVAAAKDEGIACICAQVPWLDGREAAIAASKMQGFGRGIRLFMHGQRDMVRSWFGLPPHKIPIAGRSGSVAIMPFSEAYEAFSRFASENFVNEACARIMIRMDKYRPIKKAGKVKCPALVQICDSDEPLRAETIENAITKMGPHSEAKHYPIGHFDIYEGENLERAIADQIGFFKKHLI
jgi:dienelactone hydrolase